jgi:secreted trypsin-like serine protease
MLESPGKSRGVRFLLRGRFEEGCFMTRSLFCVVVSSLVLSCQGMVDGPDQGSVSMPIINGSAPDRSEHAAVVSLHAKYVNSSNFSPSPFCSGTLIAPELVLTAAHCLTNGRKPRSAGSVAASFADDPSVSFAPRAVAAVIVHADYDRNRLLNDIGLLRLQTPVTEIKPVPNLAAQSNFTQADVSAALNLNFAGFGYSDLAKTEFGVKLQVDQPLGGLGCTVPGCPSGAPTETQISYVQDPDGPCNGDSGGPAFVDRSGTWYVGGVTSYGDGSCALYGASTNVAAFAGWISSQAACVPAGASCADGSVCCAPLSCSSGKFKTCR